MPVLLDPLPAATARLLRAAVLDLATTEHRRHFPAVVHLGTPGGPEVRVTDDPRWDRGIRADVVGTVIHTHRMPAAWVWLTRPGHLSLADVDAAWLAPVLSTAAENGLDATYVVVTRHGWLDPRSDTRHTWRRIRQR